MEEVKYKFNCDNCEYNCNYESEWIKHCNTELHKTGTRKKRSDYKESYECEKCEYKTRNIIILKQHKLNEHSNLEERKKEFKYYCELCDIGTFSKDLFNNHKKSNKHVKHESRIK